MGCWNATCNISNLPIYVGDKIVIIPLIQTTKNAKFNTCYPTDNFVPFCFAMFGQYNDYGGIENIKVTPENEKLIRFYDFFIKNEDKTSYSKIEIENNIEDFINNQLCHKNLYIKTDSLNHNDGMAKVNYFMAHQEIYEILIQEIGNRIPYGKEKSYKFLLKECYMEFVNEYKEKMKKNKDNEIDNATSQIFLDFEIDKISKQIFCDLENISPCRRWWCIMAKEYFASKNDLIIDCAVEKTIFTFALDLFRRGYLCDSGVGSQSQETRLHYLVAQFIIKHIEEDAKKQNEDSYIQIDNCGVEETIFFYDK